MIPLIVLLSVFAISVIIGRFLKKNDHFSYAGRLAMSVMLLFTAIGHFIYLNGMAQMVPDPIPFKEEVVFLTGLLEILFAVGLLIPVTQKLTGWMLIIFLFLILPANIKAALENLNYQTGEVNGPGMDYLWFRIPLQILFIAWTYLFTVHLRKERSTSPHKN